MPSPIFVVGRNRSGTKWLSNILANHPDVASVQRPGAGGILENFLPQMSILFGDLSIDENYYGFTTCFAQTNLFKLTGFDEQVLYTKRINNYYGFFRYIMDLYGQKEGKSYWLHKANSLQLEEICLEFPDAKIIIIQRDVEDNIRSTVGLRRLNNIQPPPGGVIRDVSGYYFYQKVESRFQERGNVFTTKYELLKENKERTVASICDFIGIKYDAHMLVDRFRENTSFRNGISKEEILTKQDLIAIKLFSPIFKVLPWQLYQTTAKFAHHIRGVRPTDKRFMSLEFTLLEQELKLKQSPAQAEPIDVSHVGKINEFPETAD